MPMSWPLFILVNAALFIRPADLFQAVDVQIYNYLMILCLLSSASAILKVISLPASEQSPITACVVGMLPAIVVSHLAHLQFGLAYASADKFVKVVAYYLLFISVVNSPAHLKAFLLWLGRFVIVLTALALLHYHEIIYLPSLDTGQHSDVDQESGEIRVMPRLYSTGLFNDPNDLCNIDMLGILIALYAIIDLRRGFLRLVWVAPLAMFLYAVKLTHSRGGLITVAAAILTLALARFGRKKAVLAAALLLPIALVAFGGRQTTVDVTNREDTAQNRIQLWAEGLAMFRQEPLFGIGMDEYAEQAQFVAHNSFVHTYAELGFLGGTLFTGAFYACLSGLSRLRRPDVVFYDRDTLRLRPYVFAMISAYGVGLLSLSRSYTVPTYMMFGIVTVYLQFAGLRSSMPASCLDGFFVKRALAFSVAWLTILLVFTKLMVRW
jgi:hypothetical protein